MSNYTPGPWKVLNKVQIFDENLSGVIGVCCRYTSYDAVDHANANLIAAAPDLLEALEAVLSVADRATDEFDLARKAIAKVRARAK